MPAATNLSLSSFKTYADMAKGKSGSILTYQVQINPASVVCSFGKNEGSEEEPASADGGAIPQKSPAYFKETISFQFTLDLTGAHPETPDGGTYGTIPSASNFSSGLDASIKKLKNVTIVPLRATHAPPFVLLVWGDITLKGIVTAFDINYTYFNTQGKAIRAAINLTIEEFINREVEESKYQSPDITRIPTIKAGDTLPALCREFYGDARYYAQIASRNDLPSFRRLRMGTRLVFPPLEKK